MKTMNTLTIAIFVIVMWALSSFFLKIAIDKLGIGRAILWSTLAFILIDLAIFGALVYYKIPTSFELGSWAAIGAGICSSTAFLIFYWLLQRTQASIAVPLTALYPALTVVLAVLILKEKIKLVNAVGVLLAIAAGILLAL